MDRLTDIPVVPQFADLYEQGEHLRPLVADSFIRFTTRDVSDFYATSFALQALPLAPDTRLNALDKHHLQHGLERSSSNVALASVDAITREILSNEIGGTVTYGRLHEDPEVAELAAKLSEPGNPYIGEENDRLFAQNVVREDLIPEVILKTYFGIRLRAKAAVEQGASTKEVAAIAREAGAIGETLFAAMDRPTQTREQVQRSEPHANWRKFASAISTFGNAESLNAQISGVDNMINAQHGGSAGDGRMIVRTAQDFAAVYALLDSKADQDSTHSLTEDAGLDVKRAIRKDARLNGYR